MGAYSVAGFHVIAGVCVLAAVRHLSSGLWRPVDKGNMLFGVMCWCTAGTAFTQAQLYQTWSIEEHASLLKWNISVVLAFLALLPWFTAAITGRKHRPWLIFLSLIFIAVLAINLIRPHGAQIEEIERIETRYMPWGEPFASPVGRILPSFWIAAVAGLVTIADSLVQFWLTWRRQRSGTSLMMLLSISIYFLFAIEAALVRSQVINFVHLGPYGIFLMVVSMSLTLSFRSRQTLMASEQRFRALVEQSPFGIQVLAADGGTVQVNPAWRRLSGVEDEHLRPVIERAFQGHEAETAPRQREGNQWIRSFIYPIKDPGGLVRNVIVMHEDITEEKRAADEARAANAELSQVKHAVVQQERLRALGQMAGGIAHDINNAISPAAMYVDALLEQDTTLSPRSRERLSVVQQAIAAVVQTVARLREFCRPRETQAIRENVDVNELVRQSVALTQARWQTMSIGKGISIQVKVELTDVLPAMLGIASEIRDAIVNLIFNAVDAMPDGGTITLQTRALADATVIEVRDTGTGMDEQTRRRCLEPFFSTKGEQGNGLGLAMVYGMLKRHDGEIAIISEPGRGTTMRMVFPSGRTRVDRQATARAPEAVRGHNTGARILIADDDPQLLESLRAALEADGHHVLTADDGQAAIDAFEAADRSGSPFAAVITDFAMPDLDGRSILAKPGNLAELRMTLERLLQR